MLWMRLGIASLSQCLANGGARATHLPQFVIAAHGCSSSQQLSEKSNSIFTAAVFSSNYGQQQENKREEWLLDHVGGSNIF
jgi:hypothetical protein